jgi:hypothetical protein
MESSLQKPAKTTPEVTLNLWNKWFRQTHRWVSIAFTLAVIVNGVAVKMGKYNGWLGLSALLPLALLLLTGLYLFALPYATKWRSGRLIYSKNRSAA